MSYLEPNEAVTYRIEVDPDILRARLKDVNRLRRLLGEARACLREWTGPGADPYYNWGWLDLKLSETEGEVKRLVGHLLVQEIELQERQAQ